MEPGPMAWYRLVRRTLEDMGRTQEDLSRATGISRSTFSRWAKGHVPRREHVGQVAAELGIDRADAFAVVGQPEDPMAAAMETMRPSAFKIPPDAPLDEVESEIMAMKHASTSDKGAMIEGHRQGRRARLEGR